MADKSDLTMGMANAVDTYIVQPNSTGDGYDFYDLSEAGELTKVVDPALPTAIRLDVIEQNALEYQSDGTIKTTLTQYQNDVLFRTLLAKNRPTKVGTRPDVTLIDGQKILGSAGTFSVVQLVYGNLLNDFAETGKKRLLLTAFGSIAASSGSFTGKDGSYNQPTYEFQSTSIPTGYKLTIPTALYDNTLVTVTTPTLLNAGETVKESYVDIP